MDPRALWQAGGATAVFIAGSARPATPPGGLDVIAGLPLGPGGADRGRHRAGLRAYPERVLVYSVLGLVVGETIR
jgi:hypothetical protein